MPRNPFQFKSQTEDSLPMMVADSVPNSNIVGPMFLSPLVHDRLINFVDQPELYQPLVVLGPPKCSKTAVLHDVLPRMVAARAGGITPVFVRLTFELDDTPEIAADRIWQQLRDVAHAFGVLQVDVPAKVIFADARFKLPDLIDRLARLFEKNDYQLWLLFDEISVRFKFDALFFLFWSILIVS